MEKPEMKVKMPRDRSVNWSAAEKECLRECVNAHLDVVENRGNDISLIERKKNAWKTIRETMLSSGYDRDISKLKAQWVRMKISTKKAVANIKRATIATGNYVQIPELSTEKSLIEGMIVHELEEDTILIDSNTCVTAFIKISTDELHSNSDPIVEKVEINTPPKYAPKGMKENKKCSSAIKQLRNLPNTSSKNGILLDRQRQISKEMDNADEVFKLQIKQLKAQIEHQSRINKLEAELLSLKLFQFQREIDHKEELHTLRLDNL